MAVRRCRSQLPQGRGPARLLLAAGRAPRSVLRSRRRSAPGADLCCLPVDVTVGRRVAGPGMVRCWPAGAIGPGWCWFSVAPKRVVDLGTGFAGSGACRLHQLRARRWPSKARPAVARRRTADFAEVPLTGKTRRTSEPPIPRRRCPQCQAPSQAESAPTHHFTGRPTRRFSSGAGSANVYDRRSTD